MLHLVKSHFSHVDSCFRTKNETLKGKMLNMFCHIMFCFWIQWTPWAWNRSVHLIYFTLGLFFLSKYQACSDEPCQQAADSKRKAGTSPKLHLQNKYGIPCLVNNPGVLCLRCMWSLGALRVHWWTSSPLSPRTERWAGIVGFWE